jgi:predicted flap endonuclease-1-like 5' DNA nuclease
VLYTLLKFLGWGVLLALIGGCIGWALRSLKCRGEIARAHSSTLDADEVERMRHRLANLEQVVAERDRLRIQLADVRHADSPGIVGADVPIQPSSESVLDSSSDVEADALAPDEDATTDAAASLLIVPDADADDVDVAPAAGSTTAAESAQAAHDDEPSQPAETVELDVDAAATELGKKITLDDLTVVEGIGPKISALCSGIGVSTWRQLADTDIAELQSMLDAAGSRYAVHKPGTWPRQAELLATGKWADFKRLIAQHHNGK